MRLARKGSMSSCGDIGLNVLRKWIQSTVSCLLPLRLDKKEEIILYQPDNEVRLEVRLEDETVWLNRQQLSVLFNRDIKTIGKHVNNALKEELAGISVVANFATTAADGKTYQVDYYNQRRCSRSRNWAFRRRPLQSCCRMLPAAAESACRQYRAVRWFLLPEGELRPRQTGRQRIANMAWRSNGNLGRSIAFTEMSDYESLTKVQCPHVPAIWST